MIKYCFIITCLINNSNVWALNLPQAFSSCTGNCCYVFLLFPTPATHMMTSWYRNISALLALCEGNSTATAEFPHKGQGRGALMFSLVCAWINSWVNNQEASDLRRHRGDYDVTVLKLHWYRIHAALSYLDRIQFDNYTAFGTSRKMFLCCVMIFIIYVISY